MGTWGYSVDDLIKMLVEGNSQIELQELLLCFIAQNFDMLDEANDGNFRDPHLGLLKKSYITSTGEETYIINLRSNIPEKSNWYSRFCDWLGGY